MCPVRTPFHRVYSHSLWAPLSVMSHVPWRSSTTWASRVMVHKDTRAEGPLGPGPCKVILVPLQMRLTIWPRQREGAPLSIWQPQLPQVLQVGAMCGHFLPPRRSSACARPFDLGGPSWRSLLRVAHGHSSLFRVTVEDSSLLEICTHSD